MKSAEEAYMRELDARMLMEGAKGQVSSYLRRTLQHADAQIEAEKIKMADSINAILLRDDLTSAEKTAMIAYLRREAEIRANDYLVKEHIMLRNEYAQELS